MTTNQGDPGPSSSSGSSSDNPSPTDARTPPHHYESILRSDSEGDEEATETGSLVEATGTVRRKRHNNLPSSARPAQSYGTMDDMTSEAGPSTEDRLARIASKSSASQFAFSPDNPSSPGRPRTLRKVSTKHAPHRGQEFSTDDNTEEYESDVAHKKVNQVTKGVASGQSLQRQPSMVRRRTGIAPSMPKIDSRSDEGESDGQNLTATATREGDMPSDEADVTAAEADADDEDDETLSDAESFTLKDKQQAINETHPFGIRIWKPALYKKNRSVEKTAEGDIHSSPGANVSRWLAIVNVLWTVLFGWWLALAAGLGAIVCYIFAFAPSAKEYGRVFLGLSGYLFYPFGKFVKLEQDEAYADEDEGEGRSISEYEQWQQGDLEDGRLFFGPLNSRSIVGRRRSTGSEETESLLGRTRSRAAEATRKREKRRARLFGRGQWTLGRVIFFLFFYFNLAPLMLLASLICWLLVFWVPMARATGMLFYHLRRHPLALSFHSDTSYSRGTSSRPSSILLCTYRAAGLKYWKYTIDGTNIFLINLIAVVFFVIFDYYVLGEVLGLQIWITSPGFIFALALFSVVPLAYFIGQAVASISAQSSMGVGAAINAFFSTIVEVFLYCVALSDGKGQLVEGSIIGSIFAGILFLPGLSMCFGAIKRKTQRFNVKSAGVTSTMLLFAVIAAFGPTLFYQIYGSHELNCHSCEVYGDHGSDGPDEDCRRCYYNQSPTIADDFFIRAVRPYCYAAAVLLFLSYIIGLWFTLRTHAAVIWNAEVEEKKIIQATMPNGPLPPPSISGSGTLPSRPQATGVSKDFDRKSIGGGALREGQLYKRILSQTLRQDRSLSQSPNDYNQNLPHIPPPKPADSEENPTTDLPSSPGSGIGGLSEEESNKLFHRVAEMAASAATAAAKDVTLRRSLSRERKPSVRSVHYVQPPPPPRPSQPASTFGGDFDQDAAVAAGELASAGGGHDAPNWGRKKSFIILLGATLLYAIIAEILVNTVDVVLQSVDIDEKFLGITLFALVPNTTEFLNAISFAMNGNIALSMEIGSAYALQVCLLQIPALVLFSAYTTARYAGSDSAELLNHTFNLIFPQWDMVTVILCVFLLSYVYSEGKSNYFKGSILVLTYLVIVIGFYLAGYQAQNDLHVVNERFGTVGRGGLRPGNGMPMVKLT